MGVGVCVIVGVGPVAVGVAVGVGVAVTVVFGVLVGTPGPPTVTCPLSHLRVTEPPVGSAAKESEQVSGAAESDSLPGAMSTVHV
jgi:hypothetical protein